MTASRVHDLPLVRRSSGSSSRPGTVRHLEIDGDHVGLEPPRPEHAMFPVQEYGSCGWFCLSGFSRKFQTKFTERSARGCLEMGGAYREGSRFLLGRAHARGGEKAD